MKGLLTIFSFIPFFSIRFNSKLKNIAYNLSSLITLSYCNEVDLKVSYIFCPVKALDATN